jgi:hypothetical protein
MYTTQNQTHLQSGNLTLEITHTIMKIKTLFQLNISLHIMIRYVEVLWLESNAKHIDFYEVLSIVSISFLSFDYYFHDVER